MAHSKDETPGDKTKALRRLHAQGRLTRLPRTSQALPAIPELKDGSVPLSEVLQELREDRRLRD